MIHVDTHVVIWLYQRDLGRFSERARRTLDEEALVVSPMVELELAYLHELGRASAPGREVIEHLAQRIGLRRASASFAEIVSAAAALSWTRDPFDRLIVATAEAEQARLLTCDEKIRAHYPHAFWD